MEKFHEQKVFFFYFSYILCEFQQDRTNNKENSILLRQFLK